MDHQHGPTFKRQGRCGTCGGRLLYSPVGELTVHADFTLTEVHRLHATIRAGRDPNEARALALGIVPFHGGAQRLNALTVAKPYTPLLAGVA